MASPRSHDRAASRMEASGLSDQSSLSWGSWVNPHCLSFHSSTPPHPPPWQHWLPSLLTEHAQWSRFLNTAKGITSEHEMQREEVGGQALLLSHMLGQGNEHRQTHALTAGLQDTYVVGGQLSWPGKSDIWAQCQGKCGLGLWDALPGPKAIPGHAPLPRSGCICTLTLAKN